MATKAKAVPQEAVVEPAVVAAAAPDAPTVQEPAIDAVAVPVVDPMAPPLEPEPSIEQIEMVQALVLVDCVYGKCGEVAEFAADHAEAIRAAGYIDTHPNAVASAGAE